MKDRGVVHHIVVYVCKDSFNETHLNVTGSCYANRNMPPSIRECAGSSPMYAWAVGGVVSNEIVLVLANIKKPLSRRTSN